MSGHGGGGSYGGGAGSSGQDCGSLLFKTFLNSPDPSVLSNLQRGSVLNVEKQGNAVVATIEDDQVAGSITAAQLVSLISCLEQGHKYIATVLSINGGLCEVEIRPKGKSLR